MTPVEELKVRDDVRQLKARYFRFTVRIVAPKGDQKCV